MKILAILSGFLLGVIFGAIAAFIYVFFIWPKLVGGIDWDALGPGAVVILFQKAFVFGLIGGVIGVVITLAALNRKSK